MSNSNRIECKKGGGIVCPPIKEGVFSIPGKKGIMMG